MQSANAKLKQEQQRGAEGELGNMFSTSTGAANNALGEVARNSEANTQSENASWDWAKDLFVPLAQSGARAARPGP